MNEYAIRRSELVEKWGQRINVRTRRIEQLKQLLKEEEEALAADMITQSELRRIIAG